MVWHLASLAVAMPFGGPREDVSPSPHANLLANPPRTVAPHDRPSDGPPVDALESGPTLKTYGYLGHWQADRDLTVELRALTHLALFAAEVDGQGHLHATERWRQAPKLVAQGARTGTRLHLAVANFDRRTLASLLGSNQARATLVDELRTWVRKTKAHGVNIDFEGVPRGQRQNLSKLVARLADEVDEVVVAVPAAGFRSAFDLHQLSRQADLYVMAYDYHWDGSSHAGPVDPLRAGRGTVWSNVNAHSIGRTIREVEATGANPDRLLLGLPLYGRQWPVNADTVPAKATGRGRSFTFDAAPGWGLGSLEPDSWSRRRFRDGHQLWYGDLGTVRKRMQRVQQQTTWAGVGFWTVGYETDPEFWAGIRKERRLQEARKPDDRSMFGVLSLETWGYLGLALGLLACTRSGRSHAAGRWYSGRRGESR
ncbi:MAG: glycosyl hydrolase family 18 protein [Myxococcota bacterium]